MRELTEQVGLTTGTITSMIDRLEKSESVEGTGDTETTLSQNE